MLVLNICLSPSSNPLGHLRTMKKQTARMASASLLNPVRLTHTALGVGSLYLGGSHLAGALATGFTAPMTKEDILLQGVFHTGAALAGTQRLNWITERPRTLTFASAAPFAAWCTYEATCPFRSLYRSDRRGMGGWVTSCLPHVLSDLFPLQHLRGYAQLRMGTAARSEARSYLRAEVATWLGLRPDGSHLSTGRRRNHPRRCSERSHSGVQRVPGHAPSIRNLNGQYVHRHRLPQ